jgi:hypothetical protein
LGQAHGVAAGLAQVRVVQQPVDGRGGQRFRHQLVESARVKVRRDRHRAAFIGGFDNAVKTFGGISADRKKPDVVELCRCPGLLTWCLCPFGSSVL